jgi:pimeloyl-ACP methyl ester carboxylesterase
MSQNKVNYKRSGTGRPFVFQHGLGSNLLQPQSLLSNLSGVELISMDCPGHGQSSLDTSVIPSFDYYTDKLVALLDQLGIKKAIFGGISMGAGISINMALRYPERVEALILVRPAWLDKISPQNLEILIDAAEKMQQAGGQEEFEQLAAFQVVQKSLPKAANSILGVFAKTQRTEIPTVLESMVRDCPFSDINQLNKLKQPCLVLGNEDDPLHPFEMAKIIQQYVKNSQLEKVISRYIDNEKHQIEVNQVITKFISKLN